MVKTPPPSRTSNPRAASVPRLQGSLDALCHEEELGSADHLQGRARMVGQHEDGSMVRRLFAPPATPTLIGPRPADRSEHVPPEDPCSYSGKASFCNAIVYPGLAITESVHFLPYMGMEEPFHQLGPSHPKRVLEVLAGPAPYPSMETVKLATRSILLTSVTR